MIFVFRWNQNKFVGASESNVIFKLVFVGHANQLANSATTNYTKKIYDTLALEKTGPEPYFRWFVGTIIFML